MTRYENLFSGFSLTILIENIKYRPTQNSSMSPTDLPPDSTHGNIPLDPGPPILFPVPFVGTVSFP